MSGNLVGQTIDLSGDSTLNAVFASGLKPWRFEGALDRCEISSGEVTLRLPDGRKVSDFPVGYGSFRVFGNYELTESDFTTGLLSVADAAELTKRVAGELNISSQGVDDLAARVNPTSIPTPRFWSGKVNFNTLTVGVRFTPIPRFNEVKATVDLRLNWERPLNGRQYWTEPMPPPPRYANVGFGTPPPAQGLQNPNPGPEYYEALIRAKKGERPTPGRSASVAPKAAPSQASLAITPQPEKQVLPHRFPLTATIVTLVVIIGIGTLLARRRL